jgi:hypothetical protein
MPVANVYRGLSLGNKEVSTSTVSYQHGYQHYAP